MTTTSKKTSKKKSFYFIILSTLNINPQSLKQIAIKHNISKQNINYYARQLKKNGFITKKGYGVWEISDAGKLHLKHYPSLPKSKNLSTGMIKTEIKDDKTAPESDRKINLHALNINCKILSGKINLKDIGGYLQSKYKGWQASYKKIFKPLGLTWRNNNNKSIDIFVWSRNIANLQDVYGLINKAVMFTYSELQKQKVVIDFIDFEVKAMELWVKDNDIDKALNKGRKFGIDLGRQADLTKQDAKAWVDSSPFKGIETNDLAYMENYIRQPEYVKQILMLVAGQAQNTTQLTQAIQLEIANKQLHMKVLQDISKAMQELQQSLKGNFKIVPKRQPKQTTLSGFF